MRKAARSVKTRTVTVPSPVGGLDALNSLAAMPPTNAVVMDNLVPGVNSCAIRDGYKSAVTGFAASVETLMPYNAYAGSKLFACSGTSFYDASLVGAVGAAVVTGLSNARWEHVNFGTIGGQFLICANGTDAMRIYDGSKWMKYTDGTGLTIASITRVGTLATLTTTAPHGLATGQTVTVAGATPSQYNVTAATITVTGATTFTYVMASDPGASASPVGTLTITFPVITGVNTALIKDVQVYANRVWLIEKNSFRVWYLPLNSIAGAASSIDFSSLCILGGSLAGMVTWFVNSEFGAITYAAFVTTQGEVLLYQGSDPSNAATWTKTGQFRIGRPIGQRFYERVGNDTLLITADGIIPMSKASITDRQTQSDAISFNVTQLVGDDIAVYGNNFGWQVILYPFGNKIFLNVPRNAPSENIQYVMNTITNKWCRYTGLAAKCWALYNDNIYFGSSTSVNQAEFGNDDNGAAITMTCVPAFSYFGAPGAVKLFTAARPTINANGSYTPKIGMSFDFQTTPSVSSPMTNISGDIAVWDAVKWDITPWAAPAAISRKLQWVGGSGFAASMTIASSTKGMKVEWLSTDFIFEIGGSL